MKKGEEKERKERKGKSRQFVDGEFDKTISTNHLLCMRNSSETKVSQKRESETKPTDQLSSQSFN